MKHIIFTFSFFLFLFNSHAQIEYPITEKKIVIDSYFDFNIEDPYRWLEDDTSNEVKEWINKQNKLTFS